MSRSNKLTIATLSVLALVVQPSLVSAQTPQQRAEQQREAQERAERQREAQERMEQQREAQERAQQQREAQERAQQQREAQERAQQQREAQERAQQQREALERQTYNHAPAPPAQQTHGPQPQAPGAKVGTSYVQPESRVNLGVNHANTVVARPTAITPAVRRAMTYNIRPEGVHINPESFHTYFGYAHGFHFLRAPSGACIGDCGFAVFGGEWYFNRNGGWFGIIGQMPGNWALLTDYLYIDIGDDGNYYLFDTQFPGIAVQREFPASVRDCV